jgi:hypothetical protein
MPARFGLMAATENGPVESQVNSAIVFADQVEQTPDLSDGQAEQSLDRPLGCRPGGWW